jgi:glycine cleavage system aminomethyltransferase T
VTSALETVTRRAGAVCNGAGIAAHYGSPAGELAVCVQAVGLADRSALTKLEITGQEDALAELVHRATGESIAPRGYVRSGGAWWCAASPDRIVVVAEPNGEPLADSVRAIAPPGVEVTDRSAAWSAIGLVGRATLHVLAALGVTANPRLAPPFGPVCIADVRGELLLQSDRRAVVLVDADAAAAVWRAIDDAGRPYGMSCVGGEAVSRFELLERRLDRAPVWVGD